MLNRNVIGYEAIRDWISSYNCASDMRADFWTKSPQQKLSDIVPKDEKSQKLYQISTFLS